jgi:hypothetical protein
MGERKQIPALDDGFAPPLYPMGRSYPAGVLYGTEMLDPSPLRQWKAAAVMAMLEAKCSEDAFKKLLQRLVMNACQGDRKSEPLFRRFHFPLFFSTYLFPAMRLAMACSYPAGVFLYGMEALDPSPLRQWKAAAVIAMLEAKWSEDAFKMLLQSMVMNVCQGHRKGEPPLQLLRTLFLRVQETSAASGHERVPGGPQR